MSARRSPSFAAQDYENLEIIAVDDRSSDATGEIMERAAREAIAVRPALRFEVIHVRELPAGWLGKTHAMWLAAQRASGDWILFTDADVKLRADALRRALAYAEEVKADHLVLFPTHALKTAGREHGDRELPHALSLWPSAMEGLRSQGQGLDGAGSVQPGARAGHTKRSGRFARCAWQWWMTSSWET